MENLNGKRFESLANSGNGEVGSGTIFEYFEDGAVVWAEYSGGAILRGSMVGVRVSEAGLDLRYQHVNLKGMIKTGICQSTIRGSENGKLILDEKWKWTCDDFSEGESTLVEIGK